MNKAQLLVFFLMFGYDIILFSYEETCFSAKQNIIVASSNRARDVCKEDSDQLVRWLYSRKRCSTLIQSIFKSRWVNRFLGTIADSSLSRFFINLFIKAYAIDMSEYQKSSFSNFNEFFSRALAHGARPLDENKQSVASPADGMLYCIENITYHTRFLVKEKLFDIKSFLGDSSCADDFIGGTLIVIYLAPHNYHRFHFPFDCSAVKSVRIAGNYESVHPCVYAAGIQPLTENERQMMILKTSLSNGDIIFMSVGAMVVGKIVLTYIPEKEYSKGEQIGYFQMGGSTVVMLFKKDAIMVDEKVKGNGSVAVKMGERIAQWL